VAHFTLILPQPATSVASFTDAAPRSALRWIHELVACHGKEQPVSAKSRIRAIREFVAFLRTEPGMPYAEFPIPRKPAVRFSGR
jgi:hypothetical protein